MILTTYNFRFCLTGLFAVIEVVVVAAASVIAGKTHRKATEHHLPYVIT